MFSLFERYRLRAPVYAGRIAVCMGSAVLAGWILEVPVLKSVLPGLATMKFNTALCFLLLGLSLLFCASKTTDYTQRIASVFALVVCAIAGLTLIEYAFDADFFIDEAVVRDPASLEAPGRMSAATAIGFMFLALALLFFDRELLHRYSPGPTLALLGMLIGIVGLTGYILEVKALYSFYFFSSMAVHTAVLMVLLGDGILLARPDHSFMAVITSSSIGGEMARRLIPFVVGVPLLLGWLRLAGERYFLLYESAFGTAILTVITMVGLVVVVWLSARHLNQLQAQRQHEEERFRLVVEASPSAMIVVDREGVITLVNAQAEQQFAYRRSDLIGQRIEILLPAKVRGHHIGFRAGFIADPQTRAMGVGRDLFALRKDGTVFPVEIGLTPMTTLEGIFVLTSIIDITERKRAQDEMARQQEELVRSNKDLEQFAYVASHDLQEPLRAIVGCLQILQRRYEGQLDARANEMIGYAVDGANRMQTLLEGLLAFSRVGRRGEVEQVDLEHIVDLALKNLAAPLKESGAVITRDPLPSLIGNPIELALLFQNLISNAIKYRGKAPPRIQIGAEKKANQWIISVKDNGIGVDPQYFDRIFVIFQRLHTRTEYPGTGLGLAICKKIVEQHSGQIWVESATDQGATFFVSLNA